MRMHTMIPNPLQSHLRRTLTQYCDGSPHLRSLIDSSELGRLLSGYDRANASAISLQRQYLGMARLGLYAATLGTIIGAVFLLPLEISANPVAKVIGGLIQNGTLVLSFFAIQWLIWKQLSVRWLDAREDAERLRREIFSTIVEANLLDPAVDRTSMAARLECFIKCYLDDQRFYFRKRGQQHARAFGQLTPLKVLAYVFAAVSILVGLASTLAY